MILQRRAQIDQRLTSAQIAKRDGGSVDAELDLLTCFGRAVAIRLKPDQEVIALGCGAGENLQAGVQSARVAYVIVVAPGRVADEDAAAGQGKLAVIVPIALPGSAFDKPYACRRERLGKDGCRKESESEEARKTS